MTTVIYYDADGDGIPAGTTIIIEVTSIEADGGLRIHKAIERYIVSCLNADCRKSERAGSGDAEAVYES